MWISAKITVSLLSTSWIKRKKTTQLHNISPPKIKQKSL